MNMMRPFATLLILLYYTLLAGDRASAQCGYECEDNGIEYSGDGPIALGLPPTTVLGGKVTKLDEIAPIIFLNRTKAGINCAEGLMQIDLKFEEPFYGIVYADFDQTRSCSIIGRGNTTARMDIPLRGCGTKQDPVRVFTNNIVVRFRPSLEMDGDEVITVVCRYPPPVAPPPPPFPKPLQVEPVVAQEQPLKGFQILLIICGILFLSLLLFGLAVSYYCLKNQKVRVVRKYPHKDEESLKGGTSSIGTMDTMKIPRAHALMQTAADSASETAHGSETLPSDYPSESPSTAHSEVEDAESTGSYDNRAYIPDMSVLTHEELLRRQELETETHETVTRHFRPPPPQPKFDVQMRIKKPLPPPAPSSSSSDTEGSLISGHERLEESMEMRERQQQYLYRPDIRPSPPIYSEVMRRSQGPWRGDREVEFSEEREATSYEYQQQLRALSPIKEDDAERYARSEIEGPVIPSRRPEVTSHVVDDVFLRTITEKRTIEDIERHRRQVTEYQAKPAPPAKWDVVIRNYPDPNSPPMQNGGDETATDWESVSESSSIYGVPPSLARRQQERERELIAREMMTSSSSRMDIGNQQYSTTAQIPVPDSPPGNWNALVRVLEDSPENSIEREGSTLSFEERKKWRKIITTESTLRTLLTEATSREDYERIQRDQRFERLFEPNKWEVIINILTQPAQGGDRLYDQRASGSGASNRYRRRTELEAARSNRRGSLPTLYEYDSDGSSIRHLNLESSVHSGFDASGRSRRTSRSSFKSDMDVRSMSEMTVDFARPDVGDMSETSSYYRPNRRYYDAEDDEEERGSLVRSLSQPSLARSASEFTENWGLRRSWDDSPEHSPRSSVRSRPSQNTSEAGTFATIKKSAFYQRRRDWYDRPPGSE